MLLEIAGAVITVAEKLLKDTGVSMDGKCNGYNAIFRY